LRPVRAHLRGIATSFSFTPFASHQDLAVTSSCSGSQEGMASMVEKNFFSVSLCSSSRSEAL